MDLIIKTLNTGKKVGFIPVDTSIELMAARMAGEGSSLADRLTLLDEQIKMTIREIDGTPTTYESLGKLDIQFSMKEIRQLRNFFNDINYEETPPPLAKGADAAPQR